MLLVAISASVLYVSAISADTDEVFSGIDVSVYQGDIDFDQVKNSGIEGVYILSLIHISEPTRPY